MRIILHIGQQKTGTTALQSALVADRERLARAGILYPDVGHARGADGAVRPSHNAIFFRLHGDTGRTLWQSLDEIRIELHRQIDAAQPDLVLISAEHAIMADDQEMDVLAGFDDILPGDKEIVAYLRRPDRYLMSFHKQLIRIGRRSVRPLHEPERLEHLTRTCQLDHRRALQCYLDRYGDVRVFDYDRAGDAIDHFYRHVLMLDAPTERPSETNQTNPSIPNVFANLALGHVLSHGTLQIRQVQALVRHGERDDVDLLGAANRARCLSYYLDQNEFLGSLVGRQVFFEGLEAMAEPPPGAITVAEADERYRPVFDALMAAPTVHELRRDCRLLEANGAYDAAELVFGTYWRTLADADLDWFREDLEHSSGGVFTAKDGRYVDRTPVAPPATVHRLARAAVRRGGNLAKRTIRRTD